MAFFKKFFKNIIHDRQPDNTVTVKGTKKPVFYGTVVPYSDFDPRSDASNLQSSVEAKKVDKDVIIAILVKRNNEQRQKIKVLYENMAGKRLDKDLKSCLRSDLEDVSLALLMPAHFDAYQLRKATKVQGGSFHAILTSTVGHSSAGVSVFYNTMALKQLHHWSFTFDKQPIYPVEQVRPHSCSSGTHPAVLQQLSQKYNKKTSFLKWLAFQQYAALSDISLPKALDLKLKGDIEDCLIDIVKCAWNTPAFFAEKLHSAMKGHGTRDNTLIRILVSRSEIDLKKIIDEYRGMYNIRLQEDIKNDTKGHYREVLLGICGA
uniref:Annexin n=1 Tax=Tetraodon nigroviridis TaxID=99883 RepID=H3CI33_TETNG